MIDFKDKIAEETSKVLELTKEELKEYIEFLGKIIIIPGEEEMQALANGVLRVLNGEEEAQEYTGIPVNKNIVEK